MPDFLRRHHGFLPALVAPLLLHQAATAQSRGDKDLAAISAYTLTMPKYRQYLAASINLAKAAADNPDLAKSAEGSGNLSIDQLVAKYDGVPPVKNAITRSGLSLREFALLQGAMMQTGMAYGIMKQYKISKDSAVKTAKVNPANIDFYAKNEAEITRLAKEAEAQAPKTKDKDADETGEAGEEKADSGQ
jgi:hypothetical protein